MKAFTAFSAGLENCRFSDVPTPTPKEGQVLVKLHASALNHLDLWIATGHPSYGTRSYPHVLGSDGAGIVESDGPLQGKTVALFSGLHCGTCPSCLRGLAGSCNTGQTLGVQCFGTHAEKIVLPIANAVPTRLEPKIAACLSVAGVTAWHMLKQAGVQEGDRVLVWSASSGVGSFAIQLARQLGAKVITTAGRDKIAWAEKTFGVPVIDYRKEDVSDRVHELTQDQGVDTVVEIVGPATWNTSMESVRKGGTIVTCGAVSGPDVTLALRDLYTRQIRIIGCRHGSLEEFKEVLALAEAGKIKPVIGSAYSLAEAKTAFEQLKAGKAFGKIILTR